MPTTNPQKPEAATTTGAATGVATDAPNTGVPTPALPAKEKLPALNAKTPPFPLDVNAINTATETTWAQQDALQIYKLTNAERIERLGKAPAEMTTYNEQVAYTVDRYPTLVAGAPYGADDLRNLQAEIDALNRARVAAQDYLQAVNDTILDRQARRYILATYLVADMKGQANSPFISADAQIALERALTLLEEMEKDRQQKAADSLKNKNNATAAERENSAALQAQITQLSAENDQLRAKLAAGPVPPNPSTSTGSSEPAGSKHKAKGATTGLPKSSATLPKSSTRGRSTPR